MLFYKVKKFYRKNGILGLYYKVWNRIKTKMQYEKWLKVHQNAAASYDILPCSPKITVVVPVYNVNADELKSCIDSVLQQVYTNWELCLVDDCSTMSEVKETLKQYENNKKIKVIYREKNGHISKATNTGIENATGEFIAFLDCDDVLSKDAFYQVAKVLNEKPDTDFIYSDEDKLTETGKRTQPFFKPDWSPDWMMSIMYTCHLAVYRKKIIELVGGLREGYEGAQDYDLVLRVMERTDKIEHIPHILYHWRQRSESTAADVSAKPYVLEATRKTLEDALVRRGQSGRVEYLDEIERFHVVYELEQSPKISIILLMEEGATVQKCLDSLQNVLEYPDYEVIIMDCRNEYSDVDLSGAKVYRIEPDVKNRAKIYNQAVSYAAGEYILFMDSHIVIKDKNVLTGMAAHAGLAHTGAVGCKILNQKKIYHTGICTDGTDIQYVLQNLSDSGFYYFGRNKTDANYLAVSGLCLMIQKKKFEENGAFDTSFTDGYYDIDFCFRLYKNGYYNVVRNDVVVFYDTEDDRHTIRREDRMYFEQKHRMLLEKDPFYNENLSLKEMDFSLDI